MHSTERENSDLDLTTKLPRVFCHSRNMKIPWF